MWTAIGSVSSGLALAAFIVAAVVTLLRRRLLHKERLIKSASETDRSSLVQAALDSYSIDNTDLTKQQRYDLIMEQIGQRARRFKITSVVIVILACLAVVLAAYAIGVKNNGGPEEKRYSFDFDNQSLTWAVNYLDKMATDVDIQLDQRILFGEVKTKLFSVHLNDVKLEDIIEVFCSKATVDIPLIYVNIGKSIFIKPNFIKKADDDIRLPFLIFDKKGTFHSKSGKATAYIKKIVPFYENERFSGFIVYPKEFLKEAPILQAINNDFQFTLPKKINSIDWEYRIPEFEGTGFMDSGKYDEPPAVLFKLEIIR